MEKRKHWSYKLEKFNACRDAIDWAKAQPSFKKAWETCERGDWILWIAAKTQVDQRLLVSAACDCAVTALKFVAKGEDRPRKAIAAARAWVKGKATLSEVGAATDAASAAAYAASAAAYVTNASNKTLKKCASLVRKRIKCPKL